MRLADRVVYTLTLPVAAPFYLMFKASLKGAMGKAKSAPAVPEMLERRADASDIPTATRVAPEVELDYLENRSAAYVNEMAWDAAREFARFVTGSNKPEPLSDRELCYGIATLNLTRIMKRTEDDTGWVLDLSFMRAAKFFSPERYEVDRFVFDLDGHRVEIHDSKGRVHRPGSELWVGAKAKLVAQVSIAVVVMHNWAHFWLPDVLAAKVHENLPRDTNLYRLLAAHTRFTNRHNHAGLWIQRSIDNKPTPGKKLVPWLTIPMTKEDNRQTVTEWTKAYYDEGDHFRWPERMDRRLPFFEFVGAYWDVVDAFVSRLAPSLEKDVYAKWAAEVEPWFPGFAEVPMHRAIAMAVWQLGVAHGADHQTYVNWAVKYGCSDMTRSIEELNNGRISGYERYRQLAFLKIFVDYRPPPSGLDLRLVTSPDAYGFSPGSPADNAARRFVEELKETDRDLSARGKALIPVDRMIRTICF